MGNRDHLLDTFYVGRARNDWRHRGSRLKAGIVKFWVMWWDVVLAAVVLALAYLAGARYITSAAATAELAQLRAEAAACTEVKDLARAIDNTPTGSRTAAGALLAGRTTP